MVTTERISELAYERAALLDDDRRWDLHEGRLREKPGMGAEHNDAIFVVASMIANQLDRREFRLRTNSSRLRRSAERYYIPDVCVIPTAVERAQRGRPGRLEIYADPLPLVVEVWSPSTGTYDLTAKLDEYRQRGDLEIWRIHPYERTQTAWRRQPNGSYVATLYRSGTVRPAFLPNVEIDLALLFDA